MNMHDDNTDGTVHGESQYTGLTVEDLQQQLEVAQKEAEANLNGWKRSEADFQNYQKRKENENKELIDFAREVAVAKLLPSLDSLEQALKHAPEINPSVPPGVGHLPLAGEENAAFSPPVKEEYPAKRGEVVMSRCL